MLVLDNEHIKRLEEIFDKIERFEDIYNRDPNHYPSSLWYEISKFKHDVNCFNKNTDDPFYLK